MKLYKNLRLQILLTLLWLLTLAFASAQSIPNKQTASISLPSNTKIDGLADEWDNKFLAYNKSTNIFYTIANNDGYLYLSVRAIDATIIQKMLIGGLTFTLKSKEKNDKYQSTVITISVFNKKDKGGILQTENLLANNSKTLVDNNTTDSLVNIANTQITDKSTVKVTGISSISDSIFAINSVPDIKIMGRFDKANTYTYELMVPLKYLRALIKENQIDYNIKLNGRFYNTNTTVQISPDGAYSTRSTPGYSSVKIRSTPQNLILDYSTDFEGEYKLIKR